MRILHWTSKDYIKFFFIPKGKIKRLPLLFGTFTISFLLYALQNVLMKFPKDQKIHFIWVVLIIAIIIFVIASIYSLFVLMIKRLRDLNHSGWLSLLTFIPIIQFVFWLYILLKKSDKTGFEPSNF